MGKRKNASKISACLITRNECDFIEKALSSVQAISDEQIVVDTGSTDSTPVLAKKSGATVFSFEWEDNFSKARNFAIDHCKGAWILMMDADETLAEQDYPNILDAVNQDHIDGFNVDLRVYTQSQSGVEFIPRPDQDPYSESRPYSGWLGGKVCRLFQNKPYIRYQFRVHESVVPAIKHQHGTLQDLNVAIHNFGYEKGQTRRNQVQYLALVHQAMKAGENMTQNRVYAAQLTALIHQDYQTANTLLAPLLDKPDYKKNAQLHMGLNFFRLGEFSQAFRLWRDLDFDTLAPSVQLGLIRSAIHCKQFGYAAQKINAYLEKFPQSVSALYQLANLQYLESNVQDAKKTLQKILAIKPTHTPTQKKLKQLEVTLKERQ